MCIAIVTTAHRDYPFILLSNRDEYLDRPTARARWWDAPSAHVLGGFDLLREVHGTWLGITRQGKIAVLTNFREEGQAVRPDAPSRGHIINSFLTVPPTSGETTEAFAQRLHKDDMVHGVGGFSLVFGSLQDVLRGSKGLAIISNRSENADELAWLADKTGSTKALSNSHYGDQTWPKVVNAEQAVDELMSGQARRPASSIEELTDACFQILSRDTLPKRQDAEDWEIYLRQLRNSIFIPAIGGSGVANQPADKIAAAQTEEVAKPSPGVYGTQKQTVVLVDRRGHVVFTERTLFDEHGKLVAENERDVRYTFDIQS